MPFAAVGTAVAGSVAGALVSSAVGGGGSSGSQQAAGAADPFASQRPQYQTMLSNLINNPSSITSQPGYQFNLQQGLNSVYGNNAAAGLGNSGNVLTALTQYGQNYATNQLQNQELLLAQLAGANVGSPGTAGQILQGQNQLNQAGASALGNAVGGSISQGLNSYFNNGSSGYYSGSNPFAGSGGNTYGFTSGVSDPSYGVSGGMFGG